MPKLAAVVHAVSPTGEVVVLSPGDELPGWAAAAIRNPKAWKDGEAPDLPEQQNSSGAGQEPPRGGPGSGKDAWVAYAGGLGIDVPADTDRDGVIALVEAHAASH